MAVVSVSIPQIGEGLQEARLVAVLKQPGDFVKRDEPIYQMETDKAVMDVESPVEGRLVEWLAPVDTMLKIGAPVANFEVGEAASAPADPPQEPVAAASGAESKIIPLTIPQIGEGLQEARLVAVLKQPGDTIRRDDLIYQMETDKAVMDVESPVDGVLVKWLVPVDTLVPIGAEIGLVEIQGPAPVATSHGPAAKTPTSAERPALAVSTPSSGPIRNADLSPRTRAHAASKGVSEDVLRAFIETGGRMPHELDAFLLSGVSVAGPKSGSGVGGDFQEVAVNPKQRLLASRLQRGSQLVVPGTITVACRWGEIESLRAEIKATGGEFQPSAFTMFAYAVTQAAKNHQGFRSTLRGDDVLRTYQGVNLGIAVALPGDELVLAVVEGADSLKWEDFATASRAQIELARGGKDQANEATTLSLTNMQAFGLRDAVPVVVPPAVGTLFLGEPYYGQDQTSAEPKMIRLVNLALTFDHRIVNGVGAANFLNEVRANVEDIRAVLS